MSFSLSCLCILVVFAHLTESRVLILRDDNEPLILDHKESQEERPIIKLPIITIYTPKRIRSSKKTILQFGRQIFHLDNYDDTKELRSKLKPKSISYDYVDIGELKRSSNEAKKGMSHYLNEILVLSETPQRLCFGRQCEDDLRKYNKKHKNNDETERKHKKKDKSFQFNMKRFQIVDNRDNSVRDPKFGSEEYHGKKKESKGHKKKKKKKNSSASDESKDSGSVEANSEISDEKEVKNSEEMQIENEEDSTEESFEKSENQDIDSKSDEDIPKKKSKKKKKHFGSTENTKRKTIPIEDTYFMQGNRIYHSSGKTKKKHNYDARRSRLEHFMPKRYHWDPSEMHNLGYYWFNGPKGMYSEPRVLSK